MRVYILVCVCPSMYVNVCVVCGVCICVHVHVRVMCTMHTNQPVTLYSHESSISAPQRNSLYNQVNCLWLK